MRRYLAFLWLALAATISSAQPQSVWTVVSDQRIDSRIERQLQDLAERNHVSLHFSHRARAAERTPASESLFIQLHTEADSPAFREELRREARESKVDPTHELAREGYLLRATYSHSVVRQIDIRAASQAGLHHALLRLPDLLVSSPADLPTAMIPHPQSLRVEKDNTGLVIVD